MIVNLRLFSVVDRRTIADLCLKAAERDVMKERRDRLYAVIAELRDRVVFAECQVASLQSALADRDRMIRDQRKEVTRGAI